MNIRKKVSRKWRRSYHKVFRIPLSYWDMTHEEKYAMVNDMLKGMSPGPRDQSDPKQ